MKDTALPRWDMTPVYPGIASSEFAQGFADFVSAVADLAALFDREQVGASGPEPSADAFEGIITRYNAVREQVQTLAAYLTAFVSTDSRDDLAQAKMSELQGQIMRLSLLGTRLTAWIGALDIDTLISQSAVAREHGFPLQRAKRQAAHLMAPGEEDLAIELGLTASTAWAKLHGNLTSQLMVPLELRGQETRIPMSEVRNLAHDADRDTRRAAYEAELQTWEGAALPLAAAMNSIKGEVNTLARRRGWESPLVAALLENNMDRETLDAMMTAAREFFPDFRRYLRAKARALNVPALAWYDLFAPVGEDNTVWEYDAALEFIREQFGAYSPKLRGFAERAFSQNWVDAEPRPGKRDGGYCMRLRSDESRIFMNYAPDGGSVRTLAHELGHAYHNLCLAGRTPLQRETPMTLAETASTFCETIVTQAALARANPAEQVAILEASLQGACQVVVDITSRFLFEQRVFEKRLERELSIEEFKSIMLDAQRETYGDGLDENALHPYMWAVKGHYYSTRSFYNYPYMFGLLFGLGLYAQYRRDPETFCAGYDNLLSSTGLADAATLAMRFDIDIRTPDFWRASLGVVRGDIDRFESLIR